MNLKYAAAAAALALSAVSAQAAIAVPADYSISYDPSVFGGNVSRSGNVITWNNLGLNGYAAEVSGTAGSSLLKTVSFSDIGRLSITPDAGRKIDSITYTLNVGNFGLNFPSATGSAIVNWGLSATAYGTGAAATDTLSQSGTSTTAGTKTGITTNTGGTTTTTSAVVTSLLKIVGGSLFIQPGFTELSKQTSGFATTTWNQILGTQRTGAGGNLSLFGGWANGLNINLDFFGEASARGTASSTLSLLSVSMDVKTSAVTPVPEPETYAMLLAGLGVIGGMARRRRNKAAANA